MRVNYNRNARVTHTSGCTVLSLGEIVASNMFHGLHLEEDTLQDGTDANITILPLHRNNAQPPGSPKTRNNTMNGF